MDPISCAEQHLHARNSISAAPSSSFALWRVSINEPLNSLRRHRQCRGLLRATNLGVWGSADNTTHPRGFFVKSSKRRIDCHSARSCTQWGGYLNLATSRINTESEAACANAVVRIPRQVARATTSENIILHGKRLWARNGRSLLAQVNLDRTIHPRWIFPSLQLLCAHLP